MIFHKFILVSLFFLYFSCNVPTDTSSNLNGEVIKIQTDTHSNYNEGENAIRPEFIGTASQTCPIGVICDETYDYHAY